MTLPALFEIILAALILATLTGQILRRRARSDNARRTVANMNLRIAAWWVLCAAMALALALGSGAVIALFALFSALALREFLAIAPRHHSGWIFLAFTLLQYGLVWGRQYGPLTVVLPVLAFLSIPVCSAVGGNTEGYLERTAKSCWALMICTYFLSYAPALLMLDIRGYAGRNATLLFYFLLVVQSSDVLQYVWGKLVGRTPVAPRISPNKTWEGLIGGVLSSTAIGTVLYRATPFQPWQAAAICAAITLMGFAGGLTMSAIKRERGVKDYGTLIAGHGGVLDRIDSLCFSAPIFFHLTRYFYAA
jgi:phosphatidate cytidylyltransferase